jgi:alpha-galactosidase
MGVKISVIGAGSSVFSLSLIKDICTNPHFHSCHISFMDIDPARLAAAYKLCVKYAGEMGAPLTISQTTSREESLRGADYVINTALHVNYDLWKRGWAIASGLGYRYGGSLHVMHDEAFWINFYQFRLIESVYADMRRICPDAWYLIVANPVLAGVTYMLRKYPGSKIVGLCHGFGGVYDIARTAGLDPSKIQYEMSGVNHMLWLTKLTQDGADTLPALDQWVREHSREYFKACGPCNWAGPKAVDLYERFGVYPIGDTGTPGGGSWGWQYHTDAETEAAWREDPAWWFREIYFAANEALVAEMARVAEDPTLKASEKFPPAPNPTEPMVPLMEALEFDLERVMMVNILNDGEYVPGIPRDFEVEIPARVRKNTIQGLPCSPLPKALVAHILRDRVAPVEIELDAYLRGDYDALLALILTDPWTRGEAQARALLDGILNQPEMLEMREHYKRRRPCGSKNPPGL